MKLLFDATPLGRGRYYPRGRTGIFRVTAELLAALAERSGIELRVVALDCRGEAQAELERLGIALEVQRSAWDRALFPLFTAAVVPGDWQAPQALSNARRKTLRTLVELVESVGGAPRGVAPGCDVCHSPYLSLSELGLAGRLPSSVVTVHDLLPLTHSEYFPNRDHAQLERVVADVQAGAHAHCVSEYTRRALLELLPGAAERCFVAPLAASAALFHRPDPGAIEETRRLRAGGRRYVLWLGTLDPRKNPETALRAFARLHARVPELQLLVVGAAAKNAPGSELLEGFGALRSAIHFTGFVPDAELAPLYAGAEAVLFTSRAEGFGLPVLEAMQCGAPVVSSNAMSLPEVVGDGGALLDPDDHVAFADELEARVTSQARRAEWAERALRQSRSFSWGRTAALLEAAYARLRRD